MIELPAVYTHDAGYLHGTTLALYVDCSSAAPAEGEDDDRHDFTGCALYGELRKIDASTGDPRGGVLLTFAEGGALTPGGSRVLIDGVPAVGALKFWVEISDEDCAALLPKTGTVGVDFKVRSPAGAEDCVLRLRLPMVKSTTEDA